MSLQIRRPASVPQRTRFQAFHRMMDWVEYPGLLDQMTSTPTQIYTHPQNPGIICVVMSMPQVIIMFTSPVFGGMVTPAARHHHLNLTSITLSCLMGYYEVVDLVWQTGRMDRIAIQVHVVMKFLSTLTTVQSSVALQVRGLRDCRSVVCRKRIQD